MNIQYQRNLKNSYMVVIEPEQPLNMDGQLAEKMMQRQKITGLLSWVTMEHEGDMTFWYQITGLQSLADWLSHHTLDYPLLGLLISRLLALQETLPRFYLKTEHLLLHAEQIFLDSSGDRVFFCYEPLWSQNARLSLQELMEQLLPQIDHADKEAVRFGYGLYEKCQEENADVWRYVLEQNTGEPVIGSDQEVISVQDITVHEMSGHENIQQEQKPVPPEQMDRAGHRKPRIIDKILERLSTISVLSQVKSMGRKKEEKPTPVFLFEPEETEEKCANPTTYLSAKESAEGRLLYRGAGEERSFVIEGDCFLLGGRNDQADGCMQSSGVSRNHARITREDGQYYIEDLNSRNGTYLNGELLAYKQKCPVKPGDHLRFAREEYVFY